MKKNYLKWVTLLIIVLMGKLVLSQPVNDNPCGAIDLPVNATCSPTHGTNNSATNTSGVPAPGCASYTGQDVWFKITVPASGSVLLQVLQGSFVMPDLGMATYTSANCSGPFTLLQCNDNSGPGSMPLINHSGLVPGSTLYIRVWEFGGGTTGYFHICATTTTTSCGTPATNDYCASPIQIQPAQSSFETTLSGATSDTPGNLNGVFCSSIENNIWFQFTATSTSHAFPFATSCINGIQARVYSVSYTLSGCCNSFTPVSSCITGITSTGTLFATGLTIGNDYLLMIDGVNGAQCDVQIISWSIISTPLPVELISFTGSSLSEGNLLQWITESEIDNDHFILEHSRNGIEFNKIATISGNGTTTVSHQYEFLHQGVEIGTNYYKLTQVDIDGNRKSYQVLTILNETSKNGVYKLAPNPANESTTIYYQSNGKQELTIGWYNSLGAEISKSTYHVVDGMNLLFLPLDHFESGVYLLKIESLEGTKIEQLIIQ